MNKLFTIFISGIILSGSISLASAKDYVMKIGLITALKKELHFASSSNIFFKDSVEKLSKGKIKVKLFGASTLGGPRSLLIQTKKGIVQGCDAEGAYLTYFSPLAQILSLPYIFRSEEVAWKVLDINGPFIKDFNKQFIKKTGMRIISMGENGGGFRHFSNNIKEIKCPEDMKGLKIRTMNLPIHMEMIKCLGASPTPVSWTELYTALQTGVVNGQENPISTFKMGRFEEVQKYLILDSHVYGIYCLIINNSWFNKLPRNLQQVIIHAGNITSKVNLGISQYLKNKDLAYIQSKGVKVYFPTQKEKNKFKALVRDKVLNLAKKNVGKKWVNKLLKSIANAEKALGY